MAQVQAGKGVEQQGTAGGQMQQQQQMPAQAKADGVKPDPVFRDLASI